MERTTERNRFGLPNIVIPAEVLFCAELTSTEKILFGFLNNLSHTAGGCWASNRYLGKLIGAQPETISTMLSKLQDACFIDLQYHTKQDGMKARRIYINKMYMMEHEDTLHKKYQELTEDFPSKKPGRPLRKNRNPLKQNLNPHKGKIETPLSKSLNKIDKEIGKKIDNIYLSDFKKSDNMNGGNIPSMNNKEKKPSIKERNKQYFPIVEKLSDIIQTTKNIKHTPNQLRSWAHEVRQLVEGNRIPPDRINKALDWYEEHVGEEYVPIIESGSSLREKFVKLENAMQRGNNDNGNKQNPTNSGTRSVSTPPKDKYARALARRKRRAENNRQEA